MPILLSGKIHVIDYSLGQSLSVSHPDLKALPQCGIGSWFSPLQCEELIAKITAES